MDNRLKYVDISGTFRNQASGILIACKQSQRSCEVMAKQLATRKPKTPEEFDRIEAMKDFVLKTSSLNDKVLSLLDYMTGLLTDISEDSKILIEGAIIRDRLNDQSEQVEILVQQREALITDLYDLRKNQINPK
jgi:hypothetical protein